MNNKKTDKTNAMRILDGAGVKYSVHSLGVSEAIRRLLSERSERTFLGHS